MIGYKFNSRSMLHFNELDANSHYRITVERIDVKGNSSIEVDEKEVSIVHTDAGGEILLAEMTKIIQIEYVGITAPKPMQHSHEIDGQMHSDCYACFPKNFEKKG